MPGYRSTARALAASKAVACRQSVECCPISLDAEGDPNRSVDIGEAARGDMREHRFQDIWKKQCEAACRVRDQHGVISALDYLIGEKLLNYAEAAVTRPEFARELPRFVAEVRNICSAEEIRHYLDYLERMAAFEDGQAPAEGDDGFLMDTPEQRAAARARLVQLKDLLTPNVLGTG
jgi:hypothetical protein